MNGQVLFLENEARTIEPEVALARSLGFEALIFPRPLSLANHLGRGPNLPVVAVLLDMRMAPKTLAEIGMPNVKTEDGEAVGLAVVERYLRSEDHGYSDVPVGFLTGFDVTPEVQKRLDKLSRHKNDAVVLRKGEDRKAFKKFLHAARGSQTKGLYTELEKYRESLKIAALIIWEIIDDPTRRALIFGLKDEYSLSIEDLQEISTAHYNLDFADRAVLIIDMKTRLDAIFGEDLSNQREWLSAGHALLGGVSPMDSICTGHQHDLKKVVGMLRLVTG